MENIINEVSLVTKTKTHAKELTAYFNELKKQNIAYKEIILKILDFELEYLTSLGQEKLAKIYLSEIHYKGDEFDINRYPLHNILIECTYMARANAEMTEKYSGGFVWQIIVDSFQSHLLDWIIAKEEYNVREKLVNHVAKIINIFSEEIS